MNARTPAVSVVVIAYNEAARIADCVLSIARQQFTDIEIIVVDDGSLDGTVSVLRRALGHDDRLRVLELGTNQGRGAARRAGLEAATGATIGFVDADIVLDPTWLDRLLVALPGNAAVSGIAVPDGDCAVLWRIFSPTARIKQGSEQITGNNVLFDGAVIRETGFDAASRLGEDFRLASTLRRQGHRLTTVADVTVEHREAKTYAKALRWLYDSGVDATSLLVEFRRFRLPDLAWLLWLGGMLLALPTMFAGIAPALVMAGVATLTAGISFGHTFSRFDPRTRTGRWALAAIANLPLMSCYLIGRTVGALRLIADRRPGHQ